MSTIQWIKLPVNFFDLPEINHILKMPQGEKMVAMYVQLLALAGSLNMRGSFVLNNTPYDVSMFAAKLNKSKQFVTKAMALFLQFDLLGCEEGTYFLPNWEGWQSADRLDKIRERDRKRKQKSRKNAALAKANIMWSVREDVTQDVTQDVTENSAC